MDEMTLGEYNEKVKSIPGDPDTKYRCSECKKVFTAKEIILIEHPSNLTIIPNPMMGPMFGFEKDGKTFRLHCPKCRKVSLFGFDRAETEV